MDFGYYNMDCMDGMKQFPDKYFDLAIVDPVYGDVKAGGYMTGKSKGGVALYPEYDYSIWNQPKTDKAYFDELFRVSEIAQGNKALNEKRIHPTQKPVALYNWIIREFAQPRWKLLDTHVGSGSSLIAFSDAGMDFVGFEKEKSYYEKSAERLKQHRAQITLFDCGMERR